MMMDDNDDGGDLTFLVLSGRSWLLLQPVSSQHSR
jgi:hypothetical protein